jgi:two-component system sensor histidine kinase/response regulator
MVTGFGADELREEAATAGVDAFLVKPVSQSTLVDEHMRVFAPEEGESRAAAMADGTPNLAGVRLLLAEDNEINQQIAVELLEGAGASLVVANNGREVVERLFADGPDRYDGVLMDLQMPEMDGFEATRRIRTDARFARVPIIAMTAHAMAEERERCLESGMVDHITKPIDPRVMFQTLTRWVKASPGAARPVTAAPAAPQAAEAVPAIDGVDVQDALQRLGGRTDLYAKIVRQFAEGQADAVVRLRAALADHDEHGAERIAHTLKGLAGTIGATELAATALEVEQGLRQGRHSEEQLVSLSTLLTQTVGAITAALPATPVAAPQSAAVSDPSTVLGRLGACLAAGDVEAQEILEAHAEALASGLGRASVDPLRAAVEAFEFDRALELLRTLVKERGLNVEV